MAFLAGDAEPLPWWLGYLIRAERWHCKPWELYKGRKNRDFWLLVDDWLQDSRADAARWREKQEEKETKRAAKKPKRGRRR